jgi:membrane protease subunit HflC
MNNPRLVFFIGLIAVVIFVGSRSFYVVQETQQALLLRFGEIRSVSSQPGLYFKLPEPIERVITVDDRLLPLQTPELETADATQRRFVVDAVARWRVTDPRRFYQAVGGSNDLARLRLEPILSASIRRVIGQRPFNEVLAERRAEIMREIEEQAAPQARNLGIELVDVRIRRADQPDEISARTFERMRSDRQREATEVRARGQEEARRIRAEAENQAVVTRAEAQRDSERRRGEGDAQRNRIFAEAFTRDPAFFAFYRSMAAYEAALGARDTTFVLSPNSEFFRYFNAPQGSGGAPGQAPQAAAPAPAAPVVASPAAPAAPPATAPAPAANN